MDTTWKPNPKGTVDNLTYGQHRQLREKARSFVGHYSRQGMDSAATLRWEKMLYHAAAMTALEEAGA